MLQYMPGKIRHILQYMKGILPSIVAIILQQRLTLSRQLLCQMYTEWRLSWPQQELQMKLLHGNDYVCMGAYVIMVETAKNTFHSFPFALPILQSHLKSMVYTAEWPRRLKEHLTLIREYKNLKPLHLIRS